MRFIATALAALLLGGPALAQTPPPRITAPTNPADAANKGFVDGAVAGLAARVPTGTPGVANGAAVLGPDGKVPAAQLPPAPVVPPAPTQTSVLGLLNLTTNQLDALRALTSADLAALKALAANGSTGAQQTLQAYVQVAHIPAGPIPTSSAVPFNATLKPGSVNVLDATMGTAGNVRNITDLLKFAATRDLLGNIQDPTSFPGKGIPGNFGGIYEDYPDGDPRSLHVFSADHLSLIFRSVMGTDSDNQTKWKSGYMRPLVPFKRGMTFEAKIQVGGQESDRGGWQTLWGFTGTQLLGLPRVVTGGPSFELDGLDGLQDDKARPGSTFRTGIVTYNYVPDGNGGYRNDPTPYGPPGNTYMTDNLDWTPRGDTWANANTSYNVDYFPSAAADWTRHPVVVRIEWRQDDTFVWAIDGKTIRTTHAILPATYTETNDNTAVPAELVGQQVALYPQISHQGYNQNAPSDKAILDARQNVRSEYQVFYVRMWQGETTATPPASPVAEPSPAIGGQALTWVNQGGAAVYKDVDGALVLRAPFQGNSDEWHGLFRPMPAVGSCTLKMRQTHAGVNFYYSGLNTRNSATGENSTLAGLFPNADFIYMGVWHHASLPKLGDGLLNPANRSAAQLGHDYLARATSDGTNITYAVGPENAAAGAWTTIGQVTRAAVGNPDQVGMVTSPYDGQSVGAGSQATLSGITCTSSTDVQAAAP